MKLTKRLQTVADFIKDGVRIVDVGTDHGYIPVWLAKEGRAERIAASDINEGPLSRAKISAMAHGVEDKIEFVLTDGLKGLDDDFDTVILAGMGGDSIVSILNDAPWTKNGVRLIIQPQSKISRLSEWLYSSGYRIEDASLTEDAGKLYLVMLVCGGTPGKKPSCGEYHVPRALILKRDPLLSRYLIELEKKLSRALEGMMQGGYAETEEYSNTKKTLEDIRSMREEINEWQR